MNRNVRLNSDMRRVLPLKKASGRFDNPRLMRVPLPSCMQTGLSKPRLTGKERHLYAQYRHAGQAHALRMSVKPGKRGGAEFDDELALTKLKFHDALL